MAVAPNPNGQVAEMDPELLRILLQNEADASIDEMTDLVAHVSKVATAGSSIVATLGTGELAKSSVAELVPGAAGSVNPLIDRTSLQAAVTSQALARNIVHPAIDLTASAVASCSKVIAHTSINASVDLSVFSARIFG